MMRTTENWYVTPSSVVARRRVRLGDSAVSDARATVGRSTVLETTEKQPPAAAAPQLVGRARARAHREAVVEADLVGGARDRHELRGRR
eukprot:4819829-Prymnesium_polylepis.1